MSQTDYSRIEQAIHFLEEHAREQPPLDTVAEHVGLSPYYFQRLFKRWAGVSPKRFLQYLTIENARHRLRDSASTLDTALDVGLSGPGRLHDLFVSIDAVTPGEYKSLGHGLKLRYGLHTTPFGDCLIALTERGICSLGFVGPDGTAAALTDLQKNWQYATLINDPETTLPAVEQIFAPEPNDARKPLTIMLCGTNFQIKVWEALLRIPEGAVTSYSALADAVGHPGASRAIGSAAGRNPVAYLIPCHRVLRADGEIGGYRWGTARKKAILALEAILHGDHSSRQRESFPAHKSKRRR